MAHLRKMAVRTPHLIVEYGEQRLAASIPDRVRWTIGREASSDLPIGWDGSVSRAHATVERLGGLLVVEDSGVSRNGTFVGGKRALGRTRVHDGDEITCGNTPILVRLPPSTESTVATITLGRSGVPTNLALTPAELRVVEALVAPRDLGDETVPTNRQVAATLGLSIETVRSHLRSIGKKLTAIGVLGSIDRERIADLAAAGLLGGAAED
jgi:pSer/pThr/pTyr-binding forkhead associated (FHA) protein